MHTHPLTSISYQDEELIVCDPCYVITHEIPKLDNLWKVLCDEWYPDKTQPSLTADKGTIIYGDIKILYTSTAYGDGTYRVNRVHTGEVIGDAIGVDAGMICVMKLSDALKLNPKILESRDTITTIKGFTGVIHATGEGLDGDLVVDTKNDDEDDE